jgi:hypothetical protein
MLGPVASEKDAPREDTPEKVALRFDFFIRPNIPRPCGNGYFPRRSLESPSGA